MRIGFDSDRYVETQAEHIRERIGQFGGKLYLEFGGKIFDDHHASRVLPGYVPDNKVRMLRQLSDEVEIVIVVNANDIESGKRRSDIGITYAEDARRLMDIFKSLGLYVGSVCLTRFAGQPAAVHFQQMLEDAGVRVWRHYSIDGYPANVEKILSEDGFGKNDYIQTTKPLVGPRLGQAGHLPVAAVQRARPRRAGGLCQVRDLPRVEPGPEPPREHRVRGRHRRP